MVLRIGLNPTRSTSQCHNTTHACNNTYTKMNLSTVKWTQWDKTQSRELLGPFVCVCIALCTTVVHNIAQNRPANFPSYPPDNHHCSDDVYLSEGGRDESLSWWLVDPPDRDPGCAAAVTYRWWWVAEWTQQCVLRCCTEPCSRTRWLHSTLTTASWGRMRVAKLRSHWKLLAFISMVSWLCLIYRVCS